MKDLLNAGFILDHIEKKSQNGYPNDVYFYKRVLNDFFYQEVRIDYEADRLAFENSWGSVYIFKIWLGVKQAICPDNLEKKRISCITKNN